MEQENCRCRFGACLAIEDLLTPDRSVLVVNHGQPLSQGIWWIWRGLSAIARPSARLPTHQIANHCNDPLSVLSFIGLGSMIADTPQEGSVWKDGFLFIGNQLALDFVNSRPLLDQKPSELLPDFSALLRWFQAAGLLTSRQAVTLQQPYGHSDGAGRVMGAMRALREDLRKELLAWEKGGEVRQSTINSLNRLLAEHPMLTRLARQGKNCSNELYFDPKKAEDLFAPIVHSAAMLFASADRARVRKCGHCVLHFLDTSKKGTRRWCSMQLCGNRLKVAAYAARQRSKSVND